MHGDGTVPGGAGIWKGQPVTDQRLATVATGWPLAKTRDPPGVVVDGAAWVQVTTAPTWRR
jgi:hypothetical protein